jgi:plastocyanin
MNNRFVTLSRLFALGAVVSILLCAQSTDPPRVTVTVKNFSFDPKEVTVATGTTVEWTDASGKHTIEADKGEFKSETLTAGGKFEHKFDKPGTYDYFCGFHGSKGGHDMAGKIIVK